MKKVLMVCFGNICRSPAAEAILQNLIQNSLLKDTILVESAGTSSYHEGHLADPRTIASCEEKGHKVTSKSRALKREDGEEYDHIFVMDSSNLTHSKEIISEKNHHKIKKILDYYDGDEVYNDVPDPYYSGENGFYLVIELLENSCRNILKNLLS